MRVLTLMKKKECQVESLSKCDRGREAGWPELPPGHAITFNRCLGVQAQTSQNPTHWHFFSHLQEIGLSRESAVSRNFSKRWFTRRGICVRSRRWGRGPRLQGWLQVTSDPSQCPFRDRSLDMGVSLCTWQYPNHFANKNSEQVEKAVIIWVKAAGII